MDGGVCHRSLHGAGEQAEHGKMVGQRGGRGQRASSSLTNKLLVVITGGGKAGQLQVLLLAQTGALWACGKLALEVREGWRCQALGAH